MIGGTQFVSDHATTSDLARTTGAADLLFLMEHGPTRRRPGACRRFDSVPDMDPDRRAHRRTALDRPLLLETSRTTATVRTVDVSGGGLKLRSTLALAIGDRVTVYFELPIGFGIEATAEVQRFEGDLVALRFVEIARESVLAIRSFCRVSGLMSVVRPPSSTSAPAQSREGSSSQPSTR